MVIFGTHYFSALNAAPDAGDVNKLRGGYHSSGARKQIKLVTKKKTNLARQLAPRKAIGTPGNALTVRNERERRERASGTVEGAPLLSVKRSAFGVSRDWDRVQGDDGLRKTNPTVMLANVGPRKGMLSGERRTPNAKR
jgi:hypothetical protein